MANSGKNATDKFFEDVSSKIVQLTQGIADLGEDWRMPHVLITGNESPEEVKAIIQSLREEAEEIKNSLIEMRDNRRKKNEELRKKIMNAEEEIRKSSRAYDERISLLEEHGYVYERKTEQGSSSVNRDFSEGLENSLLSSAEMIGMASFNGDITGVPSLCDIPSSTPFVIRKKN